MSLAYDVIPVTIVTGFLGSGKSTLLADVLHGDAARETAVLVNEFGEVGLDHLLVGEINAETVLLDNGCLCCAVRGELKDALADLFSRRMREEVPPFKRVVLETSGLATPAPIIATLLADRVVASHYRLSNIVTLVDAGHAMDQQARHPEWLHQVCAADRILISKADTVDDRTLEVLTATLANINPAAAISLRGARDDIGCLLAPFDHVMLADRLLRRVASASGTHRFLDADGAVRQSTQGRLTAGEHSARLDAIRSFSIDCDTPLDWAVFTLWLTMLLNRHGDNILRVKGLLAVSGSDRPAVLHAVNHLVYPIQHLDQLPEGVTESRLVFITENLDADAVQNSYRQFKNHLQISQTADALQ